MNQPIKSQHLQDDDGNPAGGTTTARGLVINWQNGPLLKDGERVDPNGCFVETVIEAVIDRLEYYQTGKFSSPHNDEAIELLRNARGALQRRIAERASRGVEGTHEQ